LIVNAGLAIGLTIAGLRAGVLRTNRSST